MAELNKIVKIKILDFAFMKSAIKTNNATPKIILIVFDLSPVKTIEIKKMKLEKNIYKNPFFCLLKIQIKTRKLKK